MEITKPEDLRIYNISVEIAEIIWSVVANWDYFSKNTIGKQLVRSADSISQNIAEGYGRFYYKENKLFCYYARGSTYETICTLKKASSRNLIDEETINKLIQMLEKLLPKLNKYINSIGKIPESDGGDKPTSE